MRKILWVRSVAIGTLTLVGSGCSLPIQRVDVQSFEARGSRLTPERVHAEVTTILVGRGFDIKATDREAGLITTEYKKFAAKGTDPPFDYYLQIRTNIRVLPSGEVTIKMSPFVKEQNRMNAAAFTERELSYCEGEAKNIRQIDSMHNDGWQALGQLSFMNVVTDIATRVGMSVDDITKNVTRTPKNGFLAKECEQ